MKTILTLAVVVLSLIGIADASFITYESVTGQIPPCGPGLDCGAVLRSEWASIGGIPLSAFGLLYYSTIFFLGVLQVLEVPIGKLLSPLARRLPSSMGTALRNTSNRELLLLVTAFGLLFSLYLVFLMAFIIQAWCLYCIISAVTSALLFLTVWGLQRVAPIEVNTGIIHFVWLWKLGVVYRYVLKPLFFRLDAELVHDIMTQLGAALGTSVWGRGLLRLAFYRPRPSLQVRKDGITFPTPIGLAAGFDYNGRLTQTLPLLNFGFHTIGTVTCEPYGGNPTPRLQRFPKSRALLINKGLKGLGTKKIISSLEKLDFAIPVGISIAATNKFYNSTKEQLMDILTSFVLFERSRVQHQYYELNISCPNTFAGEPFTTPKRLALLLKLTDHLHLSKPVYLKMPIDQSEEITKKLLAVANAHNIQGVIFGNLTKDKTNPAVHPDEAKLWVEQKGNVSGKPTWERSNKLISLTKKIYGNRFTIIGTGGIFTPEDSAAKLAAGADLLQLITGMIYQGPQLVTQICDHLALEKTQSTATSDLAHRLLAVSEKS